jgi:hypothetical protein
MTVLLLKWTDLDKPMRWRTLMRLRNVRWSASIPLNGSRPGLWILMESRVSFPGDFLARLLLPRRKTKADQSNCQGHHPSSLPKSRANNTARSVVALNIYEKLNPTEKPGAQRSDGDERSWDRCTVRSWSFVTVPQVFPAKPYKHLNTVILHEPGRDADLSMKSHSIQRHSYEQG